MFEHIKEIFPDKNQMFSEVCLNILCNRFVSQSQRYLYALSEHHVTYATLWIGYTIGYNHNVKYWICCMIASDSTSCHDMYETMSSYILCVSVCVCVCVCVCSVCV